MPLHQNELTPAEIRVSTLLLDGLTNRAIAQRLVISIRTVECHLSRAMAKTGCLNRLELALWIQQQTMGTRQAAR